MSGFHAFPEGSVFRCMGRRASCGVFHTTYGSACQCSNLVDGKRRIQFSTDDGETWTGVGKAGRAPAKPGAGRVCHVGGRISPESRERLDSLIERSGRTESSFVDEFVRAGLDAFEPEKLPDFKLSAE